MNGNSSAAARALAGIFLATALFHGGAPALAQSSAQQEPVLSPAEKEAERKARLKIAADGLEKLYKLQPDAQQAVEKAAAIDASVLPVVLPSKNTTDFPAGMLVTAVRPGTLRSATDEANEFELSSIFQLVMSTALVPLFVTSNQSAA